MKNIRYIIPNGLTVVNLLAGGISIILTLEGYIWEPVYLLLIAAVADFLDGMTAKLLKATSEFGKQLDSLSDLISFGLAPSVMMYQLFIMVFIAKGEGSFLLEESSWSQRMILFSSFNILIFSALRLARFNIQTYLGNDFKGLPVPASALVVVSLWIVVHAEINTTILNYILNYYSIFAVIILLSALMVSNIPMISLKFDGAAIRLNRWRYILLLGSIVLLGFMGMPSLIFIMLYYILLSVIKVVVRKK